MKISLYASKYTNYPIFFGSIKMEKNLASMKNHEKHLFNSRTII